MRRYPTALAGGVLLVAGGFAAASIASGRDLTGVTTVTGTTATVFTVPPTTTPPPRVTICHRTGSRKHPFHTITVSASAVPAHLRHGDRLGACTGATTNQTKQHGNGNQNNGQGNNGQGNNGQGNNGQGNNGQGNNGQGHGRH